MIFELREDGGNYYSYHTEQGQFTLQWLQSLESYYPSSYVRRGPGAAKKGHVFCWLTKVPSTREEPRAPVYEYGPNQKELYVAAQIHNEASLLSPHSAWTEPLGPPFTWWVLSLFGLL